MVDVEGFDTAEYLPVQLDGICSWTFERVAMDNQFYGCQDDYYE